MGSQRAPVSKPAKHRKGRFEAACPFVGQGRARRCLRAFQLKHTTPCSVTEDRGLLWQEARDAELGYEKVLASATQPTYSSCFQERPSLAHLWGKTLETKGGWGRQGLRQVSCSHIPSQRTPFEPCNHQGLGPKAGRVNALLGKQREVGPAGQPWSSMLLLTP